MRRHSGSRLRGRLDEASVQLRREDVDLPGDLGVGLQLKLLLQGVMVGLGLLEGRLTVLPDHDEGGQEDYLERHHQSEHRPPFGALSLLLEHGWVMRSVVRRREVPI